MSFLSKFSLPDTTKYARRDTFLNGERLSEEMFGKECGSGHFVGGIMITKEDEGFYIEGRTVENSTYKTLCEFHVSASGHLINGDVNVFAYNIGRRGKHGDYWLAADEGYYGQFIEEFSQKKEWDEIKR